MNFRVDECGDPKLRKIMENKSEVAMLVTVQKMAKTKASVSRALPDFAARPAPMQFSAVAVL